MIWNFHIAVELILGLLALILTIYGAVTAYKIIKGDDSTDERRSAEKKYYLLSMIGLILLVSRSLNVFYFYYVIVSLVPIIPGAMCPYGVLVANPVGFIDLGLKLVIPFGYGAFLLLDHLNKKTKRLELTRTVTMTYLFAMVPLILLDSIFDWLYFWFLEPVVVNCCRNVYNEGGTYVPAQLLGSQTAVLITIMTVILLATIVSFQFFQKYWNSLLQLSVLLSIAVIPFIIMTVQDFLAPNWIFASKALLGQEPGLPHHCPFCLVKRWPLMVLFLVAIWLGLAATGWQLIMKYSARTNSELMEIVGPLLRKLKNLSILGIISGLLVADIHYAIFLLLGVA